jgi:hypothetical protein
VHADSPGTAPEIAPITDILDAGTDAGSMVVFDPAALPSDFDQCDEPEDILKRLSEEGSVYWLNTASDGGYNLGLRLGNELPTETAEFAKRLGEVTRFNAASGRLYFTGIEYAFHQDDSRLRRNPAMGASREIPKGTYQLTIYDMDYPEDFHENLVRQRVSPSALRVDSLMNKLIPIALIGTIGFLASLFGLGLRRWLIAVVPVYAVFAVIFVLLVRSRSYDEVWSTRLAVEREYPDYWATLEQLPDE